MIREFGATGAIFNSGKTVDGIECKVSSCYYNKDNEYCTAGHIKVGPTNACCTEETNCATYRPQQF